MKLPAWLPFLLTLLVLPVLPLHVQADEEEEGWIDGLRVAPRGLASFMDHFWPTSTSDGKSTTDAEGYFKSTLKAELAGYDVSKRLDMSDPKVRDTATKVAHLYTHGGFEKIKALAKGGRIDESSSKAIAAFRNAMVTDILTTMATKLGEVRVNDFSTAPTAQSDIDQTFHASKETGPDGEVRTLRHPDSGKELTGGRLKEEFNKLFLDIFKIDPEHMEVSSHAGEATVPDWRQHPDTDEFALKLARGLEGLRNNPEAYFLEGAFRRQVDRRSFEATTKLYRIVRPLRTKAGDADVIVVRSRSGTEVEVEHTKARLEVYRDTPPEWRRGYAFGAAVGNLFFFEHHKLPEEAAERAKYLMRSMEDGMGSRGMDDKGKGRLYFDLSPQKRMRMLRRAYPPGTSDAEIRRLFTMYQIAEGIRENRGNWASQDVQKRVYGPILLEMVKERHPDRPASLDSIPPRKVEGYLKEAASRFREQSHALMVENAVHCAGPRIKDWLDPDKIDPEKIPKEHREAFRKDPKAFARNMRLASLSEIHDAFYVLKPETVDRIIQAEPDPDFRAALQDVKEAVRLKKSLVGRARVLGYFQDAAQRVRAIGDNLSRFQGEFGRIWNDGNYTRGQRAVHMKNLVMDSLGYHQKADVEKLEAEARKADAESGSSKIVSKIFNIGNADSIVQIIRAGQESGWDGTALGYAAGMELVSNCPGVAPLLAVRGALFYGEIEGAAVLMAGYLYPGVGQAYMVYNLTKGVLEVVDFEVSRGLADLVYQGYTPASDGGVWGALRGSLPGPWAQEFVVSRTYDPPPTLLYFVPGDDFRTRRLNMFDYFDMRLTWNLARQGLSKEELDVARRRLATPYFAKYVNDYADLRPGTEFGDDTYARTHFEVIASKPGGELLGWYLDRPSIREQLRDRLVKDYLWGLQRRRVAEGQRDVAEMGAYAEESAALLDRVDRGLRTLGSQEARDLRPLVSGLPDHADLDRDEIHRVLSKYDDSEVEVRIVPPEEGLTAGTLQKLRAEVYAPPGRFVKPYDYRWRLPALEAREEGGPYEGLDFVKGEIRDGRVVVRVAVHDALARPVGEAEQTFRIARPEGATASARGGQHLMRITVTSYGSTGKRARERLDLIRDVLHMPMRVSRRQSYEKAQARLIRTFERRYGPREGGDWRRKLESMPEAVAHWTIQDTGRMLPVGFKPAEIPPPAREVVKGGGPEW